MTDETANLVLEHLRGLRSVLDRVAQDVADLKMRQGAHDHHMAGINISDMRQNSEIDRINERLVRIEKRLELADAD
jgi:hypothetical protein